ncbi:hypothetical protein CCR96_02495 [Halochromatium roseum]|nr:hypothetical protein [Halochromatium roseum]
MVAFSLRRSWRHGDAHHGNNGFGAGYALAPSIRLAWIEDGDHSFKPRRQSGRTWEQNLDQATEAVLGFVPTL